MRIVVDASVAHASGGMQARHPTSKRCRDCLSAILTICHRVVMSREIYAEWKRHQSRFANLWRLNMLSKKKLDVVRGELPELRDGIERGSWTDRQRATLLKDAHLIEAALNSDGIIVSLDDVSRLLFGEASTQLDMLRKVVWVNPDTDADCLEWLADGAPPDERRQLGSQIE